MGVIFVLDEARKRGWTMGHPDWINLGQGQPEVGVLQGAPPRIDQVRLDPGDHAYGPVNGTVALREAVAAHYNRLYRAGKKPYTASNVAIVQGGRLALSRALAALDAVNVGYMLPDYSAYEDMLGLHLSRITPMPVRDLSRLTDVGALLLSNPCNPTGVAIHGTALQKLVDTGRRDGCALLLDEFYSHFTYDLGGPVSAAFHVDDPETDRVLLFDGLTKNFRYPGWRIGWVVGPTEAISVLDRVGSSIDGGPSQIAQRAALAALEPSYADGETAAVRGEFARKRDLMVTALRSMGIEVSTPDGTFYAWGRLKGDAMDFFSRALDVNVITVPGQLFDINPGKRRHTPSYTNWMRFSFGPPYAQVEEALGRLEKLAKD